MPQEMLRFMEDQKEVNVEVREKLENILMTLTSNTVIIKETNEQAKKTNGRVTESEKKIEMLEKEQIKTKATIAMWIKVVSVSISVIGATWLVISQVIPFFRKDVAFNGFTDEQVDSIKSLLEKYDQENNLKK